MAGISHGRLRWRRRAATIMLAGLAVGALALSFRTLSSAGVFQEVTPGFDGSCRLAARLAVAGIAADAKDNLLFLAVADARGNSPADGVYLLDQAHADRPPRRLSGTPELFHPSALALDRGRDGSLTLLAANRRGEKSGSIDVFAVTREAGVVTLKEEASIASSLFAHVSAVVPAGPQRFYAAADQDRPADFLSLLAGYLAPGQGRIIYYDGQVPRVVATGLRGVRGLALAPDGMRLYAAAAIARELTTYDVEPVSGHLDNASDYPLPAAPGRLNFDVHGALWTAGDPKLFARERFVRDARKPSPSAVLRIELSAGVPQSVTRIYTDLGSQIAASGVAAIADGQLFIGSALDRKFLVCSPR